MTRQRALGPGRRLSIAAAAALAATAVLPAATAAAPTVSPAAVPGHAAGLHASATTNGSFSASEPLSRDHLINGADDVVDSRTFSVNVDSTSQLRERQQINVSWTGAHPTGGIYPDIHAQLAAEQEYPVVILECRGLDSSTVPAADQLSQQTCWTHTPPERFQANNSTAYPSWRMDRYATPTARGPEVGVPTPYPKGCSGGDQNGPYGIQYWVPFVAADGTTYPGGPLGCAGIPPEAVNFEQSLQPDNTTYAATNLDGTGSAAFTIETAQSNASLGCSDQVACSLVIIPIEGISCDAAGAAPGLPPADVPPPDQVASVQAGCAGSDFYRPGDPSAGTPLLENVSVSGYLWWSASNWRNRISVPLTFAPPSNVCDLSNTSQPTYLYGSELMVQATSQWEPAFCLDPNRFKFTQVATSEPEAKNLLVNGSIEAAIQGAPPLNPFTTPTVQAPIGVTGFAIAADVDGSNGKPYGQVRLTPRLLAKLLTESYPSAPSIQQSYTALAGNPLDIAEDPEFKALNPGVADLPFYTQAAATLFTISSDSDVIYALTSYINADPAARAWLDGAADPWGMVVNPKYNGISLPVTNWPLLDDYADPNSPAYALGANPCLAANPVPYLPLVAAPLSNMSLVTLNMQFSAANSTVVCSDPGAQDQKLVPIGRENPGQRLILGVIPLGDAQRYGIPTAALQSQVSPGAPTKFTDAEGRSFVAPDDASLAAAARLLTPDASGATWDVPYGDFQTDGAAATAYPGTMLMSADVPTTGLPAADAARYANLLTFAAGAGQSPGIGEGQLPPGYLPMNAANGLGAQVAYTLAAAAAVGAQSGSVPPLVPAPPAAASPPAAPSPAPGATVPSGGSSSQGGGSTFDGGSSSQFGGTDLGSSSGTGGPSGSSVPTGTAAVAPAAAPPGAAKPATLQPVVAVGRTPVVGSGWGSLAVPVALLLALAGAAVAAAGFTPRRRAR